MCPELNINISVSVNHQPLQTWSILTKLYFGCQNPNPSHSSHYPLLISMVRFMLFLLYNICKNHIRKIQTNMSKPPGGLRPYQNPMGYLFLEIHTNCLSSARLDVWGKRACMGSCQRASSTPTSMLPIAHCALRVH